MDPVFVGLSGIVSLLAVLFFFDIPVGFAMALVGFAGFSLVVSPHAALSSVTSEIWRIFSSYGLAVIPFFILMGNICFYAGVSKRIYNTAHAWLGHVRGGIAMATIMACAGFASICGSNAATAATMSAVALPEMERLGYDKRLSAGCVASGATLGVVIPPSVVLIVIGLYTGKSIARLFFASLLPGLILSLLLMVSVWVICRLYPEMGPAGPKVSLADRIRSLPGSIEMVILFLLVMSGLYLGWFTPTEAGAAGSFFALLIVFFTSRMSISRLRAAIEDSVKTSCMIIMIVAGAVIFGKFMSVTRLPFEAANFVASLNVPSYVILWCMLVIYIIGGAIMDALGLLMITIPIFFPVAERLGYDPLWFSVIITVITTLGAITPPVGINTFVVAGT
ncbi:MAG: TRAP transporter large permease, partial [Thermodesulfobacteria bacterium]|nr:TRAP transporter large permease [Thermodesulfobacteriota bacterium]